MFFYNIDSKTADLMKKDLDLRRGRKRPVDAKEPSNCREHIMTTKIENARRNMNMVYFLCVRQP